MDSSKDCVDHAFMYGTPKPVSLRYTNKVLQVLPAECLQRLLLRPIRLPVPTDIEFPGDSIDHLFFLETGVASMTTTFADGSQVEVGLFGCESMLGVSALMGTKRSLNRVYMQIDGSGYIAPMSVARAEFQAGGALQAVALRCVQAQLCQTAQTAGCNARHDVTQRLARWLLLCADRAGADRLSVSQEFLAMMLGVRRMSAAVTIAHFKELGLISHQRGAINIVDRRGLESKACECYQVLRQHLNDYTEFDQGFPTTSP